MSATESNRAFLGLVNRRERWCLSPRGWVLLFAIASVGCCTLVFTIHPALAYSHPRKTDVYVVEGWLHEGAIRQAAEQITNENYRQVFTTGGPVAGAGNTTNPYSTSASIAAGRLKAAGIPADRVQMVPSFIRERDRTYSSALALRNYFRDHNVQAKKINLISVGVHARRSAYLFQKAFGDDVEVGIISLTGDEYDPKRWWKYSEGVKEVLTETIAYTYVKLFFHPKRPED